MENVLKNEITWMQISCADKQDKNSVNHIESIWKTLLIYNKFKKEALVYEESETLLICNFYMAENMERSLKKPN